MTLRRGHRRRPVPGVFIDASTRAVARHPRLLAVVAAGCGNNSGPTISDPKEILTKAVAAMQAATTVHVAATVDGTLDPSILGGGQTGDITLAGTTMNGDVDLAARNLHVTASIPAMLGLTADIIIVGPDTYTKLSLGGDKYTKSTTATGTPGDPATAITQVESFLARPDLEAVKKDDATCGSKRCYVVQIAHDAGGARHAAFRARPGRRGGHVPGRGREGHPRTRHS